MNRPSSSEDMAPPNVQKGRNLIHEFEQRFNELKQWQAKQVEQLQTQSIALDRKRAKTEDERRELKSSRKNIQADRSLLEELRQRFDKKRTAFKAAVKGAQQKVTDELANVHATRKELEARALQLEIRERRFAETDRGNQDAHADLSRAQSQLGTDMARLNAGQSELAIREKKQAAQRKQIKEDVQGLDHRRQQIEREQATIKSKRVALDQREQRLDAKRAAFKHTLQQAQQKVSDQLQRATAIGDENERGRAELDATRAKLDEDQARFESQRVGLAADRTRLKQEQSQITNELAKARRRQQELDEQGIRREHIRKAEVSLTTRRRTLTRYRRGLRQRTTQLDVAQAEAETARVQYGKLLEQRDQVVEAKRLLSASEAQMIRRWATRRGPGVTFCATTCIVALATASIYSAWLFVPPVWRASTGLQLTPGQHESPLSRDTWLDKQRLVLSNHLVLEETIHQLRQRGYNPFADTATLKSELAANLAVNAPEPGRLELDYRAKDKQLTLCMLESIGPAVVSYYTAKTPSAGQVRIASVAAVDGAPIRDQRMLAAGLLFTALAIITAILGLMTQWILARRRGVLQNRSTATVLDPLEENASWPPIPNGSSSPE